MKVIWAVLSENTIVDLLTNNISLIQIIDELTVPAPPPQEADGQDTELSTPFDLSLTVLYARSDPQVGEKGLTRIRMVGPGNRESRVVEHEIDLTEQPRGRSIGRMGMSPLPLNAQGAYSFKIEMPSLNGEWEEVFELPLWINIYRDDQ